MTVIKTVAVGDSTFVVIKRVVVSTIVFAGVPGGLCVGVAGGLCVGVDGELCVGVGVDIIGVDVAGRAVGVSCPLSTLPMLRSSMRGGSFRLVVERPPIAVVN